MFHALLDLICPPVCPACGDPRDGREPFCAKCQNTFATPDRFLCRNCGGWRLRIEPDETDCEHCRGAVFLFQKAVALGEYDGEWRRFVLRMKTDRTGLLARAAACFLYDLRKDDLSGERFDAVVPVPMHRSRRWERGVNSPDLIAEELGRRLSIPVWKNRLRRIRKTVLQHHLSVRDRKQNLSGAIALTEPPGWGRKPVSLAGKRILLVDDILTTGATCNEATRVFLQAGVQCVTVCVLARAVGAVFRKEKQYWLGNEKW